LGVRAVIVESFERIHRSNLVGMGVLALQFTNGENHGTLGLDGTETFDITGLEDGITPRMELGFGITRANGDRLETRLLCRIDTVDEVEYFKSGGILQYVLENLTATAA
jgi:aconitate hydratase